MACKHRVKTLASWLIVAACAWLSACSGLRLPVPADLPNEKAKMALPPYIIEPPDLLLVNAVRLVPRPPYKMKPLDVILIQFPASPELVMDDIESLTKLGRVISGNYTIEAEGDVNLGVIYGRVTVVDMTIDQARNAIEARIKTKVNEKLVEAGKVNVVLSQSRGMQQVLGPHLVQPDGTVRLGTYGSVFVTGMTLDGAKAAIEAHLVQFISDPEISVDIMGFNSKVYYVIFDGGGYGEQVYRFPSYGNETVLDALANVNGVAAIGCKQRIWIARPGPPDSHTEQVLPVDWKAITRAGVVKTNYQVFPGDRIYVQANPLIRTDNYLTMLTNPFQRSIGNMLLSFGAYNSAAFLGKTGTGTAGGVGAGGIGAVGR
jgi:polysaccharide export outer membrane protein